MKSCAIIFVIKLNIFLGLSSLQAQSIYYTAFPFLETRPDAQTTMNAAALTGIPSDNPQSYNYNPAQLGFYGNQNRISIQFFPVAGMNTWIDDDLTLNTTSLTAGYSLKNIPLGLGVSYMQTDFDLGEFQVTNFIDDTEHSENVSYSYSSFGFGLSYDLGVNISAGYSHKWINEKFTVTNKGNASDFGLLASYDHQWNSFRFGYSMGFAVRNYGDRVNYTDFDFEIDGSHTKVQRERYLPTNRVLGYGLSIGYRGEINNQAVEWARVEWSVDARNEVYGNIDMDDLLLRNIDDQFKRLILSRSDSWTEISQGVKATFLESITVGFGRIYQADIKYEDSFNIRHPTKYTMGIGVSMNPLLSIFTSTSDNAFLTYVNKHINVNYTWSTYLDKNLNGTNLSGIVVTFSNF